MIPFGLVSLAFAIAFAGIAVLDLLGVGDTNGGQRIHIYDGFLAFFRLHRGRDSVFGLSMYLIIHPSIPSLSIQRPANPRRRCVYDLCMPK